MRYTLASFIKVTALLVKAGLMDHAKKELELAGLFDKNSDYNGMLGKAVLELCKIFSSQGHSGFSAAMVMDLFNRLGKYKTLTPITNDPDEWANVAEESGKPLWQNKRNPAIFSLDSGKTWYDVDDKKRFMNESKDFMTYTSEMEKWFKKRTKRHINLVKKWANKIEKFDPVTFKGLYDRAQFHDASKYGEFERVPYIFISWDYHCKEGDGQAFPLSDSIKKEMDKASKHHIKMNRHHPEYYAEDAELNYRDRDEKPEKIIDATKMQDLDIAEMCADWLGMAEELGDNAKDWADKNVNVRWKFTDNQTDLIYRIINKFAR